MVRITRNTNIFTLIRTKESTVEDFKKLYEMSPEKFELYENNVDNIVDIAKEENRNDLIKYFTKIIKPDINKDIYKYIGLKPEDLEKAIEPYDLNTMPKKIQEDIADKLLILPIHTIEKLHRFYILFSNPKGGFNIELKHIKYDF